MTADRDNDGFETAAAASRRARQQELAGQTGDEEFLVPDSVREIIAQINEEFALLVMADSVAVVREERHADGRIVPVFWKPDTFRLWLGNRFVDVQTRKGERKSVSWGRLWLGSRERRQYIGLAFDPDGTPPSVYNLWRGFDLEPESGDYPLFAEHLWVNVCGECAELYNWVVGWFAHMVQRPCERPGTAMVLRGRQGTGKTKVGEIFGSLISQHHFVADDPRYLTGQFNAHMGSCLLLQADEAFWAGDKQAEGRLKGLVTSEAQFIERKGIDPVMMPNLVRLFITSNHQWVVPAAFEERRFCVLDVGERNMQDHRFFAALDKEMRDGGRAALLHDLLNFDLDKVNLRQVPNTAALFEQKLATLDPEAAWWFDRLVKGTLHDDAYGWPEEAAKAAFYASYLKYMDQTGIRRRASESSLGIALKRRLCRKLLPRKITVATGGPDGEHTRRVNGYLVPALQDCRAAFSDLIGWSVKWHELTGAKEVTD